MKKRVLVFITSLCMIFASAVPALAAETVSSDTDVQKAYEAYLEVEKSLYANPGDYQDFKAAFNAFDSAADVVDNDDNKNDEWERVLKEKVGTDKFIDVVFDAAFVLSVFEADIEGTPGFFTNYINYGDLKVAYELVDMYEILEGSGIDMDGMTVSIDTVNGNTVLKDAYAAAEAKVASAGENVIDVYEAYFMVREALDGPYPEDFPDVIAEFEKVLYLVDNDDENGELTQTEAIDLAILMGETNSDDAYTTIFNDWVDINVANNMVKVYNAYVDDPNTETANAFVEYYDGLYNDPSFNDEALGDLVANCVEDIHGKYSEAKNLLAGGNAGGEGEVIPEPEDNDGKGKSPDTGDDFNVLPFAAIMVLAAAGAVAAIRRRA